MCEAPGSPTYLPSGAPGKRSGLSRRGQRAGAVVPLLTASCAGRWPPAEWGVGGDSGKGDTSWKIQEKDTSRHVAPGSRRKKES